MPFGDDDICYKRRKTSSEYRIENEVKAIIAGKEPALA